MRFSNRLAGLQKPDWYLLSRWFVWIVFFVPLAVIPFIGQIQDPEAPIHDPVVSSEYFRAVIDSAFVLQEQAEKLGDNYLAGDYARDMVWLRTREQQVRHHLGNYSPFQTFVTNLYDMSLKAERNVAIRNALANGQTQSMAERMAELEARQVVSDSVDAWSARELEGFGGVITLHGTVNFLRHFGQSYLWAMLATFILLLVRLVMSRRLKEELLLAPERLLWSGFWWGHGIANYPGDTVAEDFRYVRLRNRYLKQKETWGLTRAEDAALHLMARQRLDRFDDALASINQLGEGALVQPKRTLLTTVLIAVTSGSLSSRLQAQVTPEVTVVACLPEVQEPEVSSSFTLMGGDDVSTDGSAVILNLISWGEPCVVCLGGIVVYTDLRRRFRLVRTMESRAPPVISTGGTR